MDAGLGRSNIRRSKRPEIRRRVRPWMALILCIVVLTGSSMNVSAEPEYDYSWGYGDFPNGIRIQAGKVIHVNAEAVEWYLEGVLVSYEHDYTTTEECILEKHEGDSSPDIIKIYLLSFKKISGCYPISKSPSLAQTIEANASSSGMSVQEYLNNTIITTPGLDNATPFGQGEGIILDGKKTNVICTLSHASVTVVNSAKEFAQKKGGKVLNVVGMSAPGIDYTEAQIPLHVKGVTVDQQIEASLYDSNTGSWTVLPTHITLDHVTLDFDKYDVYEKVDDPSMVALIGSWNGWQQ